MDQFYKETDKSHNAEANRCSHGNFLKFLNATFNFQLIFDRKQCRLPESNVHLFGKTTKTKT